MRLIGFLLYIVSDLSVFLNAPTISVFWWHLDYDEIGL